MSNVLIGIIGVILFIGLALAGALFLGPRFQDSVLSSRASAWAQGHAQIAHAVNMKDLVDGQKVQAITDTAGMKTQLVDTGFLKSVPVNPLGVDRFYVLRGPTGTFSGNATYVMNGFYTNVQDDIRLCAEIAKRAGMTLAADGGPPTMSAPTGSFGCFRNGANYGGDGTAIFWAYTRI